MNSTFASSYELLLSAISELELQKDSFVLRPGVDFSRKRKISFRDMILSLLTMQGGSLSTTSHDFFQHRLPADIPSLSALHQQRAKLLPDAMRYLFYHFTQRLPTVQTYDGFQLLACDGSDLNISYDPDDWESCKPSGKEKEVPISSISMRCMISATKNIQIYGSKKQWSVMNPVPWSRCWKI